MLVVVEDRDVETLPERRLDVEAVRCLDVLEVDPAHGGLEKLTEADDLLDVLRRHFDVEDVDPRELLEEDALPLHHGFGGECADVAEAEHCGAVRDDGHQVPPIGVLERVERILGDCEARLGDPR